MKFVSFEKEYPRYYAYTEDNKKAWIEVDAKKKTIVVYGISKKPVSVWGSYSSAFKDYKPMQALINYAHNAYIASYWDYYLYVDSCDGANIEPFDFNDFEKIIKTPNTKPSDIVKIQYKNKGVKVEEVIRILFNSRLNNLKLTEEEQNFITMIMSHYAYGKKITSFCFEYPTAIRYFAQWFNDKIFKIIGTDLYLDKLFQYCEFCKEAKTEPILFDDFADSYNAVKSLKYKLDNEKFRSYQLKRNLAYENEFFKVIVPTTREEVEDEGRKLHNCLGGYEWHNFLQNGNRQVVFIRRKSEPKKTYIACDIGRSGKIMQYLTYCNNLVNEQDAKDFKEEYQKYLLSIYAKPLTNE